VVANNDSLISPTFGSSKRDGGEGGEEEMAQMI
jgi:hypothetical protein